MSKSTNQNRRHTEQAAKNLGAVEVQWEEGGTHLMATAIMLDGTRATWAVSRGNIDPYKIKGWTRQAINRAKRKQ